MEKPNRNCRIQIRVSEQEKRIIEEESYKNGMTVSEYIRECMIYGVMHIMQEMYKKNN